MHHQDLTDRPEQPARDRSAAEATDPATERARRYLDLWERNLSHLSLSGPPPGGTAASGRRGR